MKVAQYVVIIFCLTYHNIIVADAVHTAPDYKIDEQAGGWLKVHRFPATWREAMLRCHREGAVLASPLNYQLAYALHTLMSDYAMNRIFLGTHEFFSEGDFVSVEGVPVADMAIKWDWQNSNISHGSCLIMSYNVSFENNRCSSRYLMYASSCTEPLPYICYRKFVNHTINECGTFDNEYQYSKSTGSCYKVHYEKQPWSTAYRKCASEGAYLVVLNDYEEAQVVKAMFPVKANPDNKEMFHIGLVAWGDERKWMTIHGDRIEDVYHRWGPGEPNNWQGVEDRAVLFRMGALADVDAVNKKAKFVCEKSPHSIKFEPPPVDRIIL